MNLSNFKKYDTKNMAKKEVKKNMINFFLSNKYSILKSDIILKIAYRNKYFAKESSLSFFRRSCLRQGVCRSVFRFFKMSRIMCRLFAKDGFLTGLRKASF